MSEVLEDYALNEKLRKKDSLRKVGIVGCGSVGQEIARIISHSGIDVVFVDVSEDRVREIYLSINQQLDEIIDRWGLTESEKRAILSRIHGTTNYEEIAECNLVMETISSNKPGTSIELRKEVFRKIETYVSPDAVITSNISTLMISDLSSSLKIPERAVGLHFMIPPTVKVVEVVKGLRTSEEAYDFVCRFAKMIGKKVVTVNESPGNISTRLIVTLINEACEVLMEGVASIENIDDTMKLGYGLQFGPFELADRIGLDKILKYMDNLYQEFGLQKFKASPIIKRLVRGNNLGRKTGKGFYKYDREMKINQNIICTEIK
ncbi:MAG: 3-hydroxyacyl-CoA dehydrogenase family protein [Bacteroidetes bacterium]|nr:3-hydroxyacyl-CoA dehydrogenase family protein [Bacteroidales bacterium]NJO68130.1 3-hydroxyacyl-CoA dehydrogenase family protein [Bacteroidota bacterium]